MKEFFMSHVYFLVTETKKGKSTDPPYTGTHEFVLFLNGL